MPTQNSWNNKISTGPAITLNSGTNAINISSDASATTVNLATGAAAKVVNLGSTNGASSLALKFGTADFSLASATGTIISAQDTGEITYPLQTAFMAYLDSDVTNVTGDGTVFTLGSGTALTEVFDQNGDFNTNGTLTAPVTGRYTLSFNIGYFCDSGSGGTTFTTSLVTSNRTILGLYYPTRRQVTNFYGANGWITGAMTVLTDMDAADTATVTVTGSGGSKTDDIASNTETIFSGYLAC